MKLSLGKYLLPTYVVLTFLFLSIPIVYTFIFSFNDSIKSNIIWRGFTLDNWLNVCRQQEVCDAFGNSLIIAVSATILATILGTMIAIALVRYRFKFRSATNLLLFLPLATPELRGGYSQGSCCNT
jgi:spermidine/putrescine transport system permease protein